jgi:hypothetical protein
MRSRKELGLKRYGSLLQPENGRDNLRDAIEEVADLFAYLINEQEERRLLKLKVIQLTNDLRQARDITRRLQVEKDGVQGQISGLRAANERLRGKLYAAGIDE